MTYSEKLKDPRWQKKRLEVLQRDGFTCCDCSDTKKTLHVHHKSYSKGRDPWDYPDDNFSTLCEDCHKSRHNKAAIVSELLVEKSDGVSPQKILCPICKWDYVHLNGIVEKISGNDNYEARPAIVRGGVLLIKAWCEAGHSFNVAFGFHKGYTFTWCERLSDIQFSEFSIPEDMS
jgi:hypothetical protein